MPRTTGRPRTPGPDALPVTWDQVHAFRLDRHSLRRRARPTAVASVLRQIGGAQAQLLSAAQQSVGARVEGVDPDRLEASLWKRRSLAKAWCMRRTLHLLPSNDLATFVRGTAGCADREIVWMENHVVAGAPLERLIFATLHAMDEPVNRTELAARVARALGAPLRWGVGGGWGNRRRIPAVRVGRRIIPSYYLLHLAGARGVVCSGPTTDGEATFVRGDAWVPGWRDRPREVAEDELLRLYLGAYGPATIDDFVAWTRMRHSNARRIWARAEEALAAVSVEGWPAWLLRGDVDDLAGAELRPLSVRLLPLFDVYLLGHDRREHLLDPRRHRSVYRGQGWVSSVLLVDGRVAGLWAGERRGAAFAIRVTPFERIPDPVRKAVRAEAGELARFAGADRAEVAYEGTRPGAPAGTP